MYRRSDDDIVGLQVAVDDAPIVYVSECLCQLESDTENLVYGQPSQCLQIRP